MHPYIYADLTKGTGRFNVTQGALNTAIGIGAALSNLLAGFVVQKAGYNVGFLGLAAIAAVATVVFWFLMPETKAEAQPPLYRAPMILAALLSNLVSNVPAVLLLLGAIEKTPSVPLGWQ